MSNFNKFLVCLNCYFKLESNNNALCKDVNFVNYLNYVQSVEFKNKSIEDKIK